MVSSRNIRRDCHRLLLGLWVAFAYAVGLPAMSSGVPLAVLGLIGTHQLEGSAQAGGNTVMVLHHAECGTSVARPAREAATFCASAGGIADHVLVLPGEVEPVTAPSRDAVEILGLVSLAPVCGGDAHSLRVAGAWAPARELEDVGRWRAGPLAWLRTTELRI